MRNIIKKADATTQHWFSNAYIWFIQIQEKKMKKNEKSWRNHATLIFKRISNFLKKQKKTEKADATTEHWFSYIYSLPPKKLSFLLMQESYLMQQCHTYLETHLLNFEKKDEKSWRNHATLIFERIYQIF